MSTFTESGDSETSEKPYRKCRIRVRMTAYVKQDLTPAVKDLAEIYKLDDNSLKSYSSD